MFVSIWLVVSPIVEGRASTVLLVSFFNIILFDIDEA